MFEAVDEGNIVCDWNIKLLETVEEKEAILSSGIMWDFFREWKAVSLPEAVEEHKMEAVEERGCMRLPEQWKNMMFETV